MFRDITEHRELNGGEEDRCHSHAQRWHICLILKLLEITEYTNSNGETQENSKKRNMHCVCLCEPQTKPI